MKNSLKIAMVVIALLLLALVAPGPAPCSPPDVEGRVASKSINAFAVDLYGKIRKPEGNLIFSPYSVSMCLAMAYVGARGRTESQMAKALHVSLEQRDVHKAFGALSAQVLAAGQKKKLELNIANALWVEKSYPLAEEYLELTRSFTTQPSGWFSSIPIVNGVPRLMGFDDRESVRQVDFRHRAESARQTINSWVERQTKNKIENLLSRGSVSADTRLVLANAVYFKGNWKEQFKKRLTKQDSFTLIDGKEVKVPMMHQEEMCGYREEPGLQVLEMLYRGGELSMVVLLPEKGRRLGDFESSLTADKLSQWIGNLERQLVRVYFPKFKITSEDVLKAALTGLGMTDAFSANADFSGMTGKRHLFIEAVVHKAFVKVNEEGTEAAVATGGTVRFTGMGPRRPEHIPVFRADHPFVFLILHKPSNCILFVGRVTNP